MTDRAKKGKAKAVFQPSRKSFWDTPDGLPPPGALTFPNLRGEDSEDISHETTMWCCDVSPDGNYVVTSGDDRRLKVRRRPPEPQKLLAHPLAWIEGSSLAKRA